MTTEIHMNYVHETICIPISRLIVYANVCLSFNEYVFHAGIILPIYLCKCPDQMESPESRFLTKQNSGVKEFINPQSRTKSYC